MRNLLFVFVVLLVMVSPAASQETDPAADFIEKIEAGKYGRIHSLLISHHGELITESYFEGYHENRLHQMFSVTKSVTSLAVGIAIEQGYISGVDATLADLLPDYELPPGKQAITLENLLTMTSGLDWIETFEPGAESDVLNITRQDDPVKYVLDKNLIYLPGTHFNYSSGTTIVIGAILENATGQSLETFVAEHIFAPLEITDWEWETTRNGLSNAGWGLSLLPRDMVKIGEMILNNGRVGDEQIVPENWLALSTQAQVKNVDDGLDYGYQWWLESEEALAESGLTRVPIAWGLGGQLIIIAPELNLVVVSTAANFDGEDGDFVDAVVQVLFPAFAG